MDLEYWLTGILPKRISPFFLAFFGSMNKDLGMVLFFELFDLRLYTF
jgi:hypothetical protein